jgi:thioredoxin reductase
VSIENMNVDVAVVGGGPAGLAAALAAKEAGAPRVLVLERDFELGGILQQCVHDGFGLLKFGERLPGPAYMQRYIDALAQTDVKVLTDSMVLELTPERTLYVTSPAAGLLAVQAGAVVLAMGCRERTRNQIWLPGTRPAGIFTAGAVQRYINMEGILPGRRVVILGSGDVGLIMARRLTLEGAEVEGVYEVMPQPGGLTRNIVQCLEDYNIPLHLSHTVVDIHGEKRLTGVTVAQVGPDRRPVPGTERYIPCDTLVLSVGLIPENELSRGAGVELHPVTGGPVVDESMATGLPGVFAAGNAVAVFDLVDYVSATGEVAGRSAARYAAGDLRDGPALAVQPGANVSFVLPQRLHPERVHAGVAFYLRVKESKERAQVVVRAGGEVVKTLLQVVVRPPEMISFTLTASELARAGAADLVVSVE